MDSINEPVLPASVSFAERMEIYRTWIENDLADLMPDARASGGRLAEAMAYAVLDGGKRIRPLLCFATAEALDLDPQEVLPVASAVELIHAFSLVHDDLPAMDDDELRRGKPATHKAFDEATAILAGDALQALAFEQLAARAPQERVAGLIQTLARATGAVGMTGGQAIDLASEGKEISPMTLERLHRLKTGSLLATCIELVCQWQDSTGQSDTQHLSRFGQDIGLAFQIHDDVLDETQSSEKLGKPQGSDRAAGKTTWVSLKGLDAAKADAESLYQSSMDALSRYRGNTEGLAWLAEWILKRGY